MLVLQIVLALLACICVRTEVFEPAPCDASLVCIDAPSDPRVAWSAADSISADRATFWARPDGVRELPASVLGRLEVEHAERRVILVVPSALERLDLPKSPRRAVQIVLRR